METDTDAARPGTSTQTPRVPHEDPPERLSGDMRKHVIEKTVGSELGKIKYPARRCHICAAHKKRSETWTTPQGGMFPEVSHSQALLGSLVKF